MRSAASGGPSLPYRRKRSERGTGDGTNGRGATVIASQIQVDRWHDLIDDSLRKQAAANPEA